MSISFSGVGSGLPIDEWVSALVELEQNKVDTLAAEKEVLQKKQTALNTLKSSYSSVQSATTKFTDCLLGAGMDMFSKVSVSSSDTSVVNATVTQFSTPASIELEVESLASSAIKTSEYNEVLKDSSKKLSDLGVTTSGNFQINGTNININADMSIDSLIYQINNSSGAGVNASLKNGRIILENRNTGDTDIQVTGTDLVNGSQNFAQILGFDNTSTSLNSKTDATFSNDLTMADYGVEVSGSVTINGVHIDINSDETLSTFMARVNDSAAGVNMTIEDNRLIIANKDGSDTPIDISGSNVKGNKTFAELMGFTAYNQSGSNAVFYVNGDRKESTTNSITSDTTGILGLSMDLLATTDDDPVTIDIKREYDSEEPLTALQNFVDAFNKMVTDTDTGTDSKNGGLLSGENNIVRIKTDLRTLVTSTVTNSGQYRSLADIGITTGAVGLSVDADTTKLQIDKNKFMEAFQKDPASVKALLIGDNTNGTTEEGLMQKLQGTLDQATNSQYGYFSARNTSLSSQISRMDQNIEKKQEYVYSYQERITKQFNYMDQMIAQMNAQFTQMQQQLASIGVDTGS